MSKEKEMNSIMKRWEIDVESYKNGAKILVSIPQCETCEYYIKGNALYCRYYDKEKKPKYVMFPQKECPMYNNNKKVKLNINNDRENRIYGGLFGFCVGDVLGVPVEFSTREERKQDMVKEMRAYGMHHQPFGTWSDDENGNGSLMRILPMAFYGRELDDKELIRKIEEISSLTHRHKRSKFACIFYVKYVIQILMGSGKMEALEDTIDFVKKHCFETYRDEIKNYSRIINKKIVGLTEDEIKSTGYVVDTLESVLWVFLRMEGYRETVLKAVNLGGDTDTIAAIVGGIAGTYYGFQEIPDSWVQCVARKEELCQMFEQFLCNIS